MSPRKDSVFNSSLKGQLKASEQTEMHINDSFTHTKNNLKVQIC